MMGVLVAESLVQVRHSPYSFAVPLVNQLGLIYKRGSSVTEEVRSLGQGVAFLSLDHTLSSALTSDPA